MRLDLSPLNPEQLSAVTAPPGPLLVLAGAGTGKTRVITYRMAHQIKGGMPGDKILAITFTNRAAREMKERLLRMYPDLDPCPTISTFHSLGYSILRKEYKALEYRRKFPIYDSADAGGVLTEVLRDIVGATTAQKKLEVVTREVSNFKNRFLSPEAALEAAQDDDDYFYARAYQKYQERLRGLNAVDFDDLIYLPVRLIEENPELADRWTQAFSSVLVDEYQDSNTSQYRFARLLSGVNENLCVVGDDDQSIYAFRGAEVEKILSFRRDFPNAEVVTLERNYRSVQTILNAANAVIANNPKRHDKALKSARGEGGKIQLLELEDEEAEAEEVVLRIKEARQRGVRFAEQAILLRSAIQARPFEEKLRFYDIAYTIVGGRSFYDRREVKDVLAYLRLLLEPADDIAALRILNTPKRGWGKGSREKLDQWARDHNCSIVQALREAPNIGGIPAATCAAGIELAAQLEEYATRVDGGAADTAQAFFEEIGLQQALAEFSTDPQDLEYRRRNADSVIEALRRYEARAGLGNLEKFLRGITLDTTEQEDEADVDRLTLLTFHGAKGLEFRCVYLVGLEDQLIPHARAMAEGGDAALEEERRLFYVAVTRAQDHLVMTRAAMRRRFGREFEGEESRFIAEIPEELLTRKAISAQDEEAAGEEAVEDFLQQMRAKFG
ncbi:MAG: UvrD-helicase domain-containing protein [Planctomycetota bacterium]